MLVSLLFDKFVTVLTVLANAEGLRHPVSFARERVHCQLMSPIYSASWIRFTRLKRHTYGEVPLAVVAVSSCLVYAAPQLLLLVAELPQSVRIRR